MPGIDQEHLVDTFLSHVSKVGEAAAFNLGEYKHLDAAQGVKGSALADQLPLLQMLHRVSPTLVFKYSQVKDAFGSVFRQRPGVRDKFPATEQVKWPFRYFATMPGGLAGISRSSGKLAPGL